MLELLIAVSIILILAFFLVQGLGGMRAKAMGKATKALVEQLKTALEGYFAEFRDYPPDGYDQDGTWNVNASGGVNVGFPARRLYGTSCLLYFLCRPLVKVNIVGSDPTDPRSQVRQRVGPFLPELSNEYVSMPEADVGGQVVPFNPNHPWADDAYWNVFRVCEIIDAYGRPLHYDKVKTRDVAYFQPDRFHNRAGSQTSRQGRYVHSDQNYLQSMSLTNDEEMVCPTDDAHDAMVSGLTQDQILAIHTDPRFLQAATRQDEADGCHKAFNSYSPGTYTPATNTGTHAPRFLGGFDIWSHGQSWCNPRDDVTSWN